MRFSLFTLLVAAGCAGESTKSTGSASVTPDHTHYGGEDPFDDPEPDADTDSDSDSDTDADADTYATGDTGGCDRFYTGPILVNTVSVTCDAADMVRFDVATDGWISQGVINSMSTGTPLLWDDEHDLISYEYDLCGFDDHLEQELTTGVHVATWVPNDSTVFTCGDHYEAPTPVMTYAARVYDLDGNFADCMAFGHDPEGLRDGDYDSACINCPTASAELSSCLVGVRSAN